MDFSAEVIGADAVAAEFALVAAEADGRARSIEAHYGAVLARKVRNRSSGRPGPRRVSGEHIASIHHQGGAVWSDDPAAHRLEVGFVGTDSRGHRIHQGPFPSFGPALDEVDDPFVHGLAAAVIPR